MSQTLLDLSYSVGHWGRAPPATNCRTSFASSSPKGSISSMSDWTTTLESLDCIDRSFRLGPDPGGGPHGVTIGRVTYTDLALTLRGLSRHLVCRLPRTDTGAKN